MIECGLQRRPCVCDVVSVRRRFVGQYPDSQHSLFRWLERSHLRSPSAVQVSARYSPRCECCVNRSLGEGGDKRIVVLLRYGRRQAWFSCVGRWFFSRVASRLRSRAAVCRCGGRCSRRSLVWRHSRHRSFSGLKQPRPLRPWWNTRFHQVVTP